jgi:hypothetical protein
MMPIEQFQRYGSFWELREEFCKNALASLRKREGLPTPELIDGKMQYLQPDGSYSTMATGTRKQDSETVIDEKGVPRTVPTADVMAGWGPGGGGFQILEVSEDGRKLTDELLDLHRDAGTYEIAERVSHGSASQQAPDFELDGTSDEEVDSKLQDYLKRGSRG